MSKPDWCPQRVWMDVGELFHTVANNHHAWGTLEQLPLAWKADLEESIARAILAAEKRGEEREREACAVVAQGEDYHTHYRTWPWWKMPDGCGNRSNESDLVRHADSIAAAIRARSTP